jgi:hypothetical protein
MLNLIVFICFVSGKDDDDDDNDDGVVGNNVVLTSPSLSLSESLRTMIPSVSSVGIVIDGTLTLIPFDFDCTLAVLFVIIVSVCFSFSCVTAAEAKTVETDSDDEGGEGRAAVHIVHRVASGDRLSNVHMRHDHITANDDNDSGSVKFNDDDDAGDGDDDGEEVDEERCVSQMEH